MFTHKLSIVEIENTIVNTPALLFIVGLMTMAAGLATVLGHNVWHGGTLPVVVTVLGWMTLVKGVVLFIPGAVMGFWGDLQYERFYYVYAAISLVIGAYLAIAGFKPPAHKETITHTPRLAA